MYGEEIDYHVNIQGRCPRGVMVKALDYGIVVSKFELQCRSFSDKHPWERLEPAYPYSYCSSRRMAVALNNPSHLIAQILFLAIISRSC